MTLGYSEHAFINGQRVRFLIWESQKALWDRFPDDGKIQACFHPYEYKLNVETNEIYALDPFGEIHVVAGLYGSGVVTHECGHACWHWAEINKLDLKENEEKILKELGLLVAAFWKFHYQMIENQTGVS